MEVTNSKLTKTAESYSTGKTVNQTASS